MIEILNRAVIALKGSDCQKFLQGMLTNDIIKKEYSYNYFLNNQGRYLFDAFIFQADKELYYLDLEKNIADQFIKRISMYKLRSEVDIEDISDNFLVIYSKEKIENSIFSQQDLRYKKLGFRSIIKNSENTISGAVKNLYNKDKYEYAIIDGSDLKYEKSMVVEYGAEELNAIDYNKGCYIGQEIISRTKYQGEIRKKIYSLLFENNLEISDKEDSNKIYNINGDKIGEICSYHENKAIALIREEKFLAMEDKLAVINNQQAKITIPDWR